jgi:hypothetical protein
MSDETDLLAAGFQIDKRDDYWIVSGSGLSFKHWPKPRRGWCLAVRFKRHPRPSTGRQQLTSSRCLLMQAPPSAASVMPIFGGARRAGGSGFRLRVTAARISGGANHERSIPKRLATRPRELLPTPSQRHAPNTRGLGSCLLSVPRRPQSLPIRQLRPRRVFVLLLRRSRWGCTGLSHEIQ